jgi:ubiquinone/menaquinone biosynthesis C-methylase UbiE
MRKKDNQTYYDEFSAGYENERSKRYHRFLDESEVRIARPYCEGRDVLEVGCGTGLIMERLKEFSRSVVGVDLSAGMLEKARERGLTVHQGDATALPFEDGLFDTVVSFKVLAHVQGIRAALSEAARVTRPGGHLVLEFYNSQSIRTLVKRLKPAHAVAESTTDEHVYTRFDSLHDIRGYLPFNAHIKQVTGIRCLAPSYHFWNLPVVGSFTEFVERHVQPTPLSRIGGFLVVVAQRQ